MAEFFLGRRHFNFQTFQRLKNKKIKLVFNQIELIGIDIRCKEFDGHNKGLSSKITEENMMRLHLFYVGQISFDFFKKLLHLFMARLLVNVQIDLASYLRA